MQQQEYIGFGSMGELSGILEAHKHESIFLVTGKVSYETSGAKKAIEGQLGGYRVKRFYDFSVNPRLEDIERGIDVFREGEFDLVIAIGGGTVMDVAKSVNILAANPERTLDYIQNRHEIKNQGLPLVAVPTTSGSGSEATKFAVIYVDGTKYSLEHNLMLPTYTLVDSQFTLSLPQPITAVTGMDALCQAIESYWSINANDESRKYASEAIKLVYGNLEAAVNHPSGDSREAMALGSHLAGKAINISKTTAPHAISYTMTSKFGIPHGHAVALTLWPIMVYNYEVTEDDVNDKRKGVEVVKRTIEEIAMLLGADTVQDTSIKIRTLMQKIGLKIDLHELGITDDSHLDLIVNGVNYQRLDNNPRIMTAEDLRKILNDIR